MTVPATEVPTVWKETAAIPEVLQAVLDRRDGIDDAVRRLTDPAVERIIAVGNGASAFVAQALWLVSLASPRPKPVVVAAPAGLAAAGAIGWRSGDVLVSLSSSGELRDLVDVMEALPSEVASVAITAAPSSPIAQLAEVAVVVPAPPAEVATHTHGYCAAVLTCLMLWAEVSGDETLAAAAADAPRVAQGSIEAALRWGLDELPGIDTPTGVFAFGAGAGWAAAQELALVVKEIAQIPCEGVETREGATTTMTALLPEHLVVSLPTAGDAFLSESEAVSRARGATVLRAPMAVTVDARLAPITAFPASVALAIELARRAGRDPDNPAWTETYYETARRAA
jgi:glucosamine--fructose-6-phosphate aminotransferase (isomerizing)